MRYILVLSAVLVTVAALQTYKSDHDDLDIEDVVNTPDKLAAFSGCFLETNTCDTVAGSYKEDLSEAVAQACSKCTPAQKHLLKRFLEGIKEKRPEDYKAFEKKYDPEGKYLAALQPVLASA